MINIEHEGNGVGYGRVGVAGLNWRIVNIERCRVGAQSGNTTTSIQTDGLMEAKYALKGGYWRNARWIFHRSALKQIAKLQDDDDRYLWSPSLAGGEPDRLLNFPVYMSEYAPSTFTTGLYVGILGDFKYYHIVDSLEFSIQRLVELYAATNQIGFIGRMESDGMPVLEEAFARVKLA